MKQDRQQQKLSLFQNLCSAPSKPVALEEIVRLIAYDDDVRYKTEAYRKMKSVLGKDKADKEVKQRKLPAFSVAVLFNEVGRTDPYILGFTRMAMVDIDHVENASQLMAAVKTDPHTLLAYVTAGGEGLHIVYRYEREQPGEHVDATTWPAAFLKGNHYYAKLTGHDYDEKCSDYTRLCTLAHDPEVYVNAGAEPFVVTDEEILATNFAPKGEKGKARREYPAGTCTATIDEAWPKMEQALKRLKLEFQGGRHHDYVMHAAFLMNRYGVDLDDLLERAAQEWADYDAQQRESTIRSCYKKTQEHGSWRLSRQGRKPRETTMITLPEIREWLAERVEVIYNLVTDMLMWRRKDLQPVAPGRAGEEWMQMDDRVVCSMRAQMAADTGKRVLKSDVTDVLHSDFARLYHPVREYVEALPAWDGTDRVSELCSHIRAEGSHIQADGSHIQADGTGDDKAQEYLCWALHKWLVAAVATWMTDFSTNHEIFVLIGPQGIYKTTFFRHLLPPALRQYFWENAHNSFASKDDHLALAENCLIEIEEIDLQNPRDISELKALATSEKVKERRPYARFREERHRLASFCGSGNQEQFLSDETGSRRWLCVKVSHIDDPRQWALDYGQLYAQLRDELRQGFRYWFDHDEQRLVERHNQSFCIESDEAQLIRSRLRPPRPGEKVTLMNASTICQFVNGGVIGRGLTSRKVSLAMSKLGFECKHTMGGNFYKVYQILPNELQSCLANTSEVGPDDTSETPSWTEPELPF